MSCCGKKNEALTCGVYNALRSPDDGRNIGNALMLVNDGNTPPSASADARPEKARKTE